MVYFICASCQETLKMAAVAKHHCYAPLSCVDCGKDFSVQTYRQHNACMTEAQKYQGALYKQPKGKKVDPQELWTGAVAAAAERGGKHKGLLGRLVGYPNVPRKRAKFLNFAKNSLGVRDERVLGELFDAIEALMPKKEESAPPAAAAASEAAAPAAEEPAAAKPESKKRKRDEAAAADADEGAKKGKDGGAAADTSDAEAPAAAGSGGSSFNVKKRVLSFLGAAPGGKAKTKRLRKAVAEEALAAGAFADADAAGAAVDARLAKLVKKGKLGQDAKFTVLAGAAAAGDGAGDDDE